MQLRKLLTVTATLATQLVSTQNISRWLQSQAKLPPCAQSCLNTGYALSNISKTDIYGTCNNPTLLKYVGSCESAEAGNCNNKDRQNIETRASVDCAVVGGIASTVYTYRFPGLPACANNCTSSGLRFSGCDGRNITCVCKNPVFANAFGPCQSLCSNSETAETVKFFEEGCAPIGGIGPYNASDIGGFLNFTGPNRTLLFYPPFYTAENATKATNATYTSSPPVASYIGAATSTTIGFYGSWTILGLIGAIMLV